MSYRSKRKEQVPQAIRRSVLEQIGKAAREIDGGNPDIHDGVHNIRKRFKKIRSLLRLVRRMMRGPGFWYVDCLLMDETNQRRGASCPTINSPLRKYPGATMKSAPSRTTGRCSG